MSTMVMVLDGLGDCRLSARFATPKAAVGFIEWRIEEFLGFGAKHIVIVDDDKGIGKAYRADGIADCVFAAANWSHAVVNG